MKQCIRRFLQLVCPDRRVDKLADINISELQEIGISGIIFDLDNTIIPWDQADISAEIREWLLGLRQRGFKIGIVSNNQLRRVKDIADSLNIPYAARAFKPVKTGFRQVSTAMGLPKEQIAVVGDQLYTDILGGNRLGFFTIWVLPISSKEFIGTKVTRQIEKITVKVLNRKKLLH